MAGFFCWTPQRHRELRSIPGLLIGKDELRISAGRELSYWMVDTGDTTAQRWLEEFATRAEDLDGR